ncbi:hypothetical protein GCM10009006_34900 [Haloarcula argentinensis]|uniref:Uncharacterized protein n=1 Tax=Haloarcula argentinensis TaxID=43776 RepID=A0A830FIP3_HALAR|nr:hypothetical protein GCM10009006_34900 [Haloarcula argentinensis]
MRISTGRFEMLGDVDHAPSPEPFEHQAGRGLGLYSSALPNGSDIHEEFPSRRQQNHCCLRMRAVRHTLTNAFPVVVGCVG